MATSVQQAEPAPDTPSSWATEQVNAAIATGLVPESLQKNYTSAVSRGSVAQMFLNLVEQTTGRPIDDYLAAKGMTITAAPLPIPRTRPSLRQMLLVS